MSSTAFAPDDAAAPDHDAPTGQARRRRLSRGGSQDYYEALVPIAAGGADHHHHGSQAAIGNHDSESSFAATRPARSRRASAESFDIDSTNVSLLSPRSRRALDAEASEHTAAAVAQLDIGADDALSAFAETARARMDACCAYCCGVDPLTVEGQQSQTGHDDATTQDFAKHRVHFGDGFWSDLWFYLRNAHSLLALFLQHPNHPYKRRARCGALFVTLAYALLLTSTAYAQSRMPFICSANASISPALLEFSNLTLPAPLVIRIAADNGVCASLPAFANTSVLDATSIYNMDTDIWAQRWRLIVTQVVGLLVLLFSRILGMAAVCSCAHRGERRRITVCCCQSAATLCYSVAFVVGLAFLAGGLVFVSLTPGTAADQWAVIGQFLLAKMLAWVYEIGTNSAFFAVAYALQRSCRYNACCVCCCGCCGFGLHAARTEASKHVSFSDVDFGGVRGDDDEAVPRL